MKKYFIIVLFMVCNALADQKTPNAQKYDLCQKIKKIRPHAPQSAYKKLAQELHDNDLSVCECVHNIINEKKEKALNILRNEGLITDDDLDKLDKKIENLETINTLEIQIPEDFPEDKTRAVIEYFEPHFNVQIKPYSSLCVKTLHFKPEIVYKHDHTKAEAHTTVITQRLDKKSKHFRIHHGFYIPTYYKNLSQAQLFADLQHELHHMKKVDDFVLNHIQIKMNKRQKKPFHMQETFNKFSRATELEADIIPASCKSLECAQLLTQRDYSTHYSFYDTGNFLTHPTTEARQAWATKIYKLRQEEERLKQESSSKKSSLC